MSHYIVAVPMLQEVFKILTDVKLRYICRMCIKKSFFWIFLFPAWSIAQSYEAIELGRCQLSNPSSDIVLKDTASALLWINNNFDGDYRLLHKITGPYSIHYLFNQTRDQIDIYKSQVKINTDKSGRLLSVLSNAGLFHANLETDATEFELAYPIPVKPNNQLKIIQSTPVYLPWNTKLLVCKREILSDFEDTYDENITTLEGHLLLRTNLLSYNQPKDSEIDTPATGLIFNPDPLTSSGNPYASPWIDSNDANTSQLAAQQTQAILQCSFENDSFRLKNSAVTLADFSPPAIPPAVLAQPAFLFSRDQPGFEDVNSFYHLSNFNTYLRNTLGFSSLCDYPIVVDAHGMNGADNSNFNPATSPPRLSFGEGGVDDAEDADVIIHEYGHAISHSAAPNTNYGIERTSLDEAGGDYLAASYSRSISANFWYNVYTWDGHNEFWNGRTANSSDHYPEDLVNNKYGDADIWSSVLMEIWELIGRETTDKLLIQATMSYATNMTMPQAALLFLEADELIYGSIHFQPIRDRMVARGLLPSDVGLPPCFKKDMRLINSGDFFNGNGNLYVQLPKNYEGKAQIYSLEGKLIAEKNVKGDQFFISSWELEKGYYLCVAGNTRIQFMR